MAAGNAAVAQILQESSRARILQESSRGGLPQGGWAVREALRTSGRPLEKRVRKEMEERFGADFSSVRVHRDTAARHSAASLGARAYSVGEHVVLGREDGDSERVLAHELAHVLQHRAQTRGSSSVRAGGEVRLGDPGDSCERAAETAAERVVHGRTGSLAALDATSAPAGRSAPPGQLTVRRLLDHTQQSTLGFGSRLGTGSRVEAAWIRTDGTLRGQPPAAEPPGYGYIRQLGLANFWIRFHLVNEKAGGPGTANNLVPASKRDNSRYHKDFEQDLKKDVDDVRKKGEGEVFFGVEVDYRAAPPAGTGTVRQQNNAAYFPAGMRIHWETYDPPSKQWKARKPGSSFTFIDDQPADPGTTTAIGCLTLGILKTLVPVRWDCSAEEISFLQSLGDSRKHEFEQFVDKYSGQGPVESVESAFHEMPFNASADTLSRSGRTVKRARITFADRVGKEVLHALSEAIAHGVLALQAR
ncbi:DUF4157 domain-containing protein [Streptomyces cinnamoneus]|uniref:eCIS core domain-containing protein n=1 Tax=Streptomyces cinnamoneus TaxID=53446 RepID=UPI00340D2923